MRNGRMVSTVGAHTVGAADGGTGIPVTGWSKDHGDMRVPHFIGLHALQLIPLLYWSMSLWRPENKHGIRTAVILGLSYAMLIGILVWQALRGQSFFAPDQLTLIVFGVWLILSIAVFVMLLWNGTKTSADGVRLPMDVNL